MTGGGLDTDEEALNNSEKIAIYKYKYDCI